MQLLPPNELVRRLVARGFSQADIARKCRTSQPTISKILNGKQTSTSFELVDALRRMYKKGRPE
jgi:transcriptional regulator with XRE-family HTH domain